MRTDQLGRVRRVGDLERDVDLRRDDVLIFDFGFREVERPRPVGALRRVRIRGVRATMTVGVPITSAARRAEMRLRTACAVGSSTLPPM